MASESRLRSVPPAEASAAPQTEFHWQPPARPASSRWTLALAAALVVALALLAWSRVQLGERIEVLEGEIRALEAAVERRNVVIHARDARLSDVKTRIGELRSLLDRPLPNVD